MEEIWKNVKGFENVYQISNFGNLKSFKKDKNGKILSQVNKKNGYFSVILTSKKKILHTRIHRLVALAFIPNPNNKPCVNHKDGNKQNNNVKNLEWCSYQENIQHAKENKLWVYNKPYKCKKVYQYDMLGNFIKEYKNAVEASKLTGVCSRNILQVASKEPFNEKGSIRKQTGGFIWRFEYDNN